MHKKMYPKKPKYYLNPKGEFVIENYNTAKPFANFFPGISGKYGIPMWTFYVNRGQGISSFGSKDKDHAILEFLPANKAWQLTSLHGFRTFIKFNTDKKNIFYEPFHNGFINLGFDLTNCMRITSYGLELEEINRSLGLKIHVEYFTIPRDSYAALARIVTITNIGGKSKRMQLVDGLPQIAPFGANNWFLKEMSRTIEAWIVVENLQNMAPFYRLSVDPADRPEVIHIKEGNFYLAYHFKRGKPEIIKPIVDPRSIFGETGDFSCPHEFLAAKNFKHPENEITVSLTPSAFSFLNIELPAHGEKTFYSIIGYMRSKEILNSSLGKIVTPGYLEQKKEENKCIVADIQQDIHTESSSKEFNLYAKQTYLDNILRGGYPVVFPGKSAKSVFYLYSRKHGDLERDYNKFQLQPAYFSQGNGNYRDVNQNRRSDAWFNPEVGDSNVIEFFNLIQPDGFNPLIVKGALFTANNNENLKSALKDLTDEKNISVISKFLSRPFTPGDVIFFLEDNKIRLKKSYDEFLNTVLSACEKIQEAEHGEGFWTDHWTYNLDLLESYLGVYPEKLNTLVFQKKAFTFYDNAETVRPRREKYVLHNGLPKQLHALSLCPDKKELIKHRSIQPHTVRADYGKGAIYQTTLINKLLCLFVNKLASLDPSGAGIEMEADKPNWFDSLNGLPALFGSSLCETFELKRLTIFIKKAIEENLAEKISLTKEIHDFLDNLSTLLKEWINSNSGDRNFIYWDKSYALKENYREKTKLGLLGAETEINTGELTAILDNALAKINFGIEKARDKKNNVYYSYFINEVLEYVPLNPPFIKPTKFAQKRLPLFLEGQVHALRTSGDVKTGKKLYSAVRKSSLYDNALKMYKVTAALKSMPEEIGRCRVFTPGWLENESIWLHMEYKYLLELIKQGLAQEFYADFKNVLIPFQKPDRYGRSTLENSSFIVSSAFPDKNLRGNGFVARLSGSTAEFIQIWLTMNLGQKPFFLDKNGKLNLSFKPILAGWLFDKKGLYCFNFLSRILVTYRNPKRKNTFGKNAAKIMKVTFNDKDGNPVEINSATIPSPYAEQIRSRQIKKIDIFLS